RRRRDPGPVRGARLARAARPPARVARGRREPEGAAPRAHRPRARPGAPRGARGAPARGGAPPRPRRPHPPAGTPGVLLNGATGPMGRNQHVVRSILAIREEGEFGLEPLLVGRDEAKLRALAEEHGLDRWTTDLDAALADPAYSLYFDAQITQARHPALRAAIE